MRKRNPSRTSLIAFALIVVPIVYVLSYAPVMRICGGAEYLESPFSDEIVPVDAPDYPVYRPVDWGIDNTPLRSPLFAWAGLWEVKRDFEVAAVLRDVDRRVEEQQIEFLQSEFNGLYGEGDPSGRAHVRRVLR